MARVCGNCGAPLAEGAKFCVNCGSAAEVKSAREPAPERPASDRDRKCPDGIEIDENGTYVWTYEQNMWKHTEVLGALLLVFAVALGGLFVLELLLTRGRGIRATAAVFLAVYAFLAVLSVASWAIVNAMHHGTQHLIFTMSKTAVTYGLLPESAETAAQIGAIGEMSGDLMGMAAGAAASQTFSNEYRGVKKIKSVPRRDLIRVHSILTKNTIYCYPHQYEFVWNYLVSHCPGARIVRK